MTRRDHVLHHRVASRGNNHTAEAKAFAAIATIADVFIADADDSAASRSSPQFPPAAAAAAESAACPTSAPLATGAKPRRAVKGFKRAAAPQARRDAAPATPQPASSKAAPAKYPCGMSSAFVGVCFVRCRKKWQAQIKVDNRKRYLGYFATQEAAAHAYDKVAGPLGRPINFPNGPTSATSTGDVPVLQSPLAPPTTVSAENVRATTNKRPSEDDGGAARLAKNAKVEPAA